MANATRNTRVNDTSSGSTIDADMLEMLRVSLRHVLIDTSTVPLSGRLAELGWHEVVADDPATALKTLFEIKGETLSTADALGPRLALELSAATGDDDLAGANVTLPSPFGPSSIEDERIRIDAVALSSPGDDQVVVCEVERRLAVCSAHRLTAEPLDGTDTSLGLLRLTGTLAADDVNWIDGEVWSRLVAHGRWLLACELVGIGRHVTASAVEYTKERVQYGKPIGVFQALQHRLANAHSLIVGAGHLVEEAGRAGDHWTALVAKCVAGQAAETACTQAQQCYGAIGFTWEHEFHRYLRRTYVLDRMLGDWRTLEHEIGERLQETGIVPRIGTL